MRSTKTEKIITTTLSLSGGDLLNLMRQAGLLPHSGALFPEVYVRVPGGGDWSNMNLDINESTHLMVRYEEHRVDEKEG